MKDAFRHSRELLDFLNLTYTDNVKENDFPTLVTKIFAGKMTSQYDDPLLKQVLPDILEEKVNKEFTKDPLNEFSKGLKEPSNILQKYQGRTLLITSNACAVNCRYCFRRHFPYEEHRPSKITKALDEISKNTSIEEIILSGGDPLLLDDNNLRKVFQAIKDIKSIKTIRIHTRLPVILPQRISERLIETLYNQEQRIVVVVHSNHPNELDSDTRRAFECLKSIGVWLLNQSVLLKGVNDCDQILIDLSKKLFDQGVLPYYLHLPDKVANTTHFYVNTEEGQRIHKKVQAKLPGYLVPKLVREIPNYPSKKILSI